MQLMILMEGRGRPTDDVMGPEGAFPLFWVFSQKVNHGDASRARIGGKRRQRSFPRGRGEGTNLGRRIRSFLSSTWTIGMPSAWLACTQAVSAITTASPPRHRGLSDGSDSSSSRPPDADRRDAVARGPRSKMMRGRLQFKFPKQGGRTRIGRDRTADWTTPCY